MAQIKIMATIKITHTVEEHFDVDPDTLAWINSVDGRERQRRLREFAAINTAVPILKVKHTKSTRAKRAQAEAEWLRPTESLSGGKIRLYR